MTPSDLVVWFPRRPKHIYKDYVQRFIKNIYIIHINNYILKYNIDVKLYYMLLNIFNLNIRQFKTQFTYCDVILSIL